MAVNFSQILLEMVKQNASDLHLKANSVPIYRINGELVPVNHPPLKKDEITAFIEKIMPERLKDTLDKKRSVDFGFSIDPVNRFRTNVFYQRGVLSVSMRRLQYEHLDFDELLLPPKLKELTTYRKGLILVTGPTGTGKSTTMAAIIVNNRMRKGVTAKARRSPYVFINLLYTKVLSITLKIISVPLKYPRKAAKAT